MKFNKFLNEAITLKDKEALKIWKSKAFKVLDFLEDYNWQVGIDSLASAMSRIFWPDFKIEFDVEPGSKKEVRICVNSAITVMDGSITLNITKETIKILRKIRDSKDFKERWIDPKRNRFLWEFIDVLSHELVHREQIEKAEKAAPGLFKVPRGDQDWTDYLADKREIVAFAKMAALRILSTESKKAANEIIETYRVFFGKGHPVFKKFMKHFYISMEELKKEHKSSKKT